jgi:hypothetical protein
MSWETEVSLYRKSGSVARLNRRLSLGARRSGVCACLVLVEEGGVFSGVVTFRGPDPSASPQDDKGCSGLVARGSSLVAWGLSFFGGGTEGGWKKRVEFFWQFGFVFIELVLDSAVRLLAVGLAGL